MEFTFETIYNQKALTTMARALRKTLRKKKSRRSHIFGWIVVILGLILAVSSGTEGLVINVKTIVTWLAILLILIVLIWEDAINGYVARKRMLPGTEKAVTVFQEDGYISTSDMGKTEWHYDKIHAIAETNDYFVFLFNMSHAQVYDKSSIAGGNVEEFSKFIVKKTGKEIMRIK